MRWCVLRRIDSEFSSNVRRVCSRVRRERSHLHVSVTDQASADAGVPPLEIIPLGGLGEFGMNMMLVACGDEAVLVDAGVMFPEPELLGVDLIVPDLRTCRSAASRRWC